MFTIIYLIKIYDIEQNLEYQLKLDDLFNKNNFRNCINRTNYLS